MYDGWSVLIYKNEILVTKYIFIRIISDKVDIVRFLFPNNSNKNFYFSRLFWMRKLQDIKLTQKIKCHDFNIHSILQKNTICMVQIGRLELPRTMFIRPSSARVCHFAISAKSPVNYNTLFWKKKSLLYIS